MGGLIQWLDRVAYSNFQNNWDDEALRQEILQAIRPEHHVLDLGAGAGIVAQMNFKGRVAKICGVDPDPRVLSNPYLDEGRVAMGEAIPYPGASFDVVIADNVLEHLERPEVVLKEVHRVLKPGGVFLAKTPNRLHYMPIIAQVTPHWFHRFIKSLMGISRHDTFPTRYRINTPAAVRRYARLTDFDVDEIKLIEGRPEYLRIWFPAYLIGFCYERIVSMRLFARFRILLVLRLSKPL